MPWLTSAMCRWLLLTLGSRAASLCRSHPEQCWGMTHLKQFLALWSLVGLRLWCLDRALTCQVREEPVTLPFSRTQDLRHLRELVEAHQ